MKRFAFSLQRLLDARQAKEQAAEQALLRARKVQADAERHRQELAERRAEHVQVLGGMQGRLSRTDYSFYMQSIERLEREGILQDEEIARCKERVAECRLKLNEEISARRVLEKLREKEQAQWQEDVRAEEQKTMDELASSRWHLQGNML